MDQKIQKIQLSQPNYKLIYADLITKEYPEKKEKCEIILSRDFLCFQDIMNLEKIISGEFRKEDIIFNQKHRSYDKKAIQYILNYQKNKNLSNMAIAKHFNLSRNTIARWKKIFISGNI